MRNAHPAEGQTNSRSQVLVLGSIESAGRIAVQLRELGFEPISYEAQGGRLPFGADPNGVELLRAILTEFREKNLGKGPLWVHPGTSYWGERAELPAVGQEKGLQIIGPPARALALFGNRLNLFDAAEKLQIPTPLLSPIPLHSVREIEQQHYPFPFALKAVKGGTSAAHYVVHDSEELQTKFPLWVEQLRRSSGEAIFLAERYLEGARQIVIPFVRFGDGRLEYFPSVDASLQCRHRKMVEICPAPALDAALEKKIHRWVGQLAQTAGFVGVGTMEFLIEGHQAFLISASPRLNRTFHLWEQVAGTKAVAWQVAALEGVSKKDCPSVGTPELAWRAGMSLRLFAEDPVLQLPHPGTVFELGQETQWTLPGAQASLDWLVHEGEHLSPSGSGLLGILWVGAQDRRTVLTAARGVLDQIWISGSLQTNERFLAELLAHPWIREGIFHSGFVDEEFLPSVRPPEYLPALLAAIAKSVPQATSALVEESLPRTERWVVGDQWVKQPLESIQWEKGPEFFSVPSGTALRGLGISGVVRAADGTQLRVCAYPWVAGKWQFRAGNWFLTVRRVPVVPLQERKGPRVHHLLALVAGRVHSLLYREGNSVPAHEPLVLVESLGILVPHALPVDTKITRWSTGAERQVAAGDVLAEFEVMAKN